MTAFHPLLKKCLVFAGVSAGLALFLIGVAAWVSPGVLDGPVERDAAEVEAARAARAPTYDPANPPVVAVDVDPSEGERARWYPKGESPILAGLVREGTLPPVAERTGPEPVVLDGFEGPGRYGGTWLRAASSQPDIMVATWRLCGASLVRWSPMGYPIRPHLAKGWEVSDGGKVWTFYLRRGMRWSDGHPFTASDIAYWWEHEVRVFDTSPPPWMVVRGKVGRVVKVDDYTVRFEFPEPHGTLLEALATMAGWPPFAPEHYLRKYHPDLGDDALIEATMKARGSTSRRWLYFAMRDGRNTEHPRMWPWLYRTHRASPPESFVRNPYYPAVDAEGNQLPYVDRIQFEVKNPRLIPVAASGGGFAMQERHLAFSDYTLLMENRGRSGYRLLHWFNAVRSAYALWPNINRRVFEGDEESALKARYLADKTFRQALSLAIDRRKIIDAVFVRQGEPAQIDPGAGSEFGSERLRSAFVEYDPAKANAMLDALGLDGRDGEGMRVFPGGRRMTWNITFCDYTGEGPGQFVVDDWARVGVRAVLRERARPLFVTEKMALLHDFVVWTGESEFNPMVEPRSFAPSSVEAHFAPGYALWYLRGGLYGLPQSVGAGVEPPVGHPARRALELLEEARRWPERARQVELFREIAEIAAENLWSISIATPPPALALVRDDFRGVPEAVIAGASYASPNNASPETFYFRDAKDSPGAIALTRREMLETVPPPDAVNPETLAKSGGGGLVGWIFAGIGVAGLVMAGVRHPYIGRRLFLMVPTLGLISVVTFGIIQLPPGDFVQTRILELQLTGDQAAADDVRRLGEAFHLNDPAWKQYARWMGLRWFLTFAEEDRGLLQGEMGRSMETGRSVNDMVGERVLLTFLVSLATIVFTWVIALPIGIYSAVRQYSWGDYVLTLLGFIGMCVPNFLLAILLMYWSSKFLGLDVTGLFSPEFAAVPEWSAAKVLDLLKHMWVPVVVIALSGTAGMIRVMRGNLLDELRKPYVTTAMAKGVRPFRLLIKYPVRLALNPFLSGIGGIFPQLVSGGAIVSIVLSLPMVGPVLLSGLLAEDVYLAASMLMVLSALGVFGTLVSDLLLMWADPRIRMERGQK